MLIATDAVRIVDRHRKDLGDIKTLAVSIAAVGLLHPIVVTSDMRLVAGERRLRACADVLGLAEIEATVLDIENLLEAERDENEQRKDFTKSERVAVAKEIEAAVERRASGPKPAGELCVRRDAQLLNDRRQKIAAEKAGFSSVQAYRRAKLVADSGDEELIAEMDSGKVTTTGAANVVLERKRKQRGKTSAKVPKAKPACVPPPKPQLVHDSDTEIADQVCSLLHRFREVADRIEPGLLYDKFPDRMRHNLDQALRQAAGFVRSLEAAWLKDRARQNPAAGAAGLGTSEVI